MNTSINQIIQYGLKNNMIKKDDIFYSVNMLLELLKLDSFEEEAVEDASIYEILDRVLDYAVKNGLIEDTITDRDLFDTKVMNCIMPRPSEVVSHFNNLYAMNAESATDYFYDLSIKSNYIRKTRTDTQGQMLHAFELTFVHPSLGNTMTFNAPLPEYFETILNELREKGAQK